MIGKKAPSFHLKNQDGQSVKLNDFKGRYLVLFFYPKDNTPGCTKESCRFRDLKAEFNALDCDILGISGDSEASHQKFIEKQSLNFPLLADLEKSMIEAYQAWGEKNLYGKKSMGIIRTTVIIDPKGKVVELWSPVRKAAEHPDVVLELSLIHI